MLPQKPQQYKWKGPPVPRAKPIPREQWEQHKDKLEGLYYQKTVDELMAEMKAEYNFTPSRRQYIFQFEKWGFHKYNTNTIDSSASVAGSDQQMTELISPSGSGTRRVEQHVSPAASGHQQIFGQSSPWAISHTCPTPHSSLSSPEGIAVASQTFQPFNKFSTSTKRPPSLTKSLREKPPVPPKKRQKLENFLASNEAYAKSASTDPYAGLELAFETPSTSLPDAQIPGVLGTDTHLSEQVSDGLIDLGVGMAGITGDDLSYDDDDDMDIGTPHATHDNQSCITASDLVMSILSSGSSSAIAMYPSRHWSSKEHLLDSEPLRERQVDSSRPIDTFSKDEIEDMRLAADFLSSLECEEDAFTLYMLIYKYHSHRQATGNTWNQPPWMTSWAIISCATCAFTTSQIEIARSLLLRKLEEPQDSTTNIEKFLFRMLLAETYARINDDECARSHIQIAMGLDLFTNGQILHGLPRKNRSFDILTYHYLIDGLGYRTLLQDSSYYDDTASRSVTGGFSDEASLGEASFGESSFRKASGSGSSIQQLPFLDKCEAWNRLLRQVPGPFEVEDESMRNPCLRSCLGWCIQELGSTFSLSQSWNLVKSNGDTLIRAEMIAIYCYLWERWQSQKAPHNAESLLWAEQAEHLMGIPAADLLKTLCSLIMSSSPLSTLYSCTENDNFYPERALVHRAYESACSLATDSDTHLCSLFLDVHASLREFHNASYQDIAFKSARQVYGKEFIENRLRIKLPHNISYVLQQRTRRSLEIAAAAFMPTRGSSLQSAEMASLHTLRDRIRNAGDMAAEVVSGLPSSVLRDRRSQMSFPSMMSELSAMTSSLSLSSAMNFGKTIQRLVDEED